MAETGWYTFHLSRFFMGTIGLYYGNQTFYLSSLCGI